MITSTIHKFNTLDNVKIQEYLSNFPKTQRAEAYGLFWIIVETLFREGNKWDLDKSKLLNHRSELTQDLILSYAKQFDKALKFMVKVEILLPEQDYYYSPFQRILTENYNEKNLRRKEQDLLVKRLEEKIAFLKNPKPLLKKKRQ